MKRSIDLARIVSALGLAWSTLGCAVMTQQYVHIDSEPPGATARVLPDGIVVTTPSSVQLERGRTHTVWIELDGYRSRLVFIDRLGSGEEGGVLADQIRRLVGLPTGEAFRLDPAFISVELKPTDAVAPEVRGP